MIYLLKESENLLKTFTAELDNAQNVACISHFGFQIHSHDNFFFHDSSRKPIRILKTAK